MKTKLLLATALFATTAIFSQKQWSLKQCVSYALENNITIKQNELNVQLAKKDVAIAKGNFLPNLAGSAGARFNSGLSQDRTGVLQNTENISASFDVTSRGNVFNGFRNLNTYKQAKLGTETSKLDLEIIKNDISLNVVNTYLNVLLAKENLEVAKTQAAISKKQIEQAKAQFEAGAIPKGNLLNAQSTAATDAQNVITQENTLNLAILRLAQLLQLPSENFKIEDIIVDTPSELIYATATQVYEKALTNRPEITKATLNLENADLNIKLAKGAYLPTLGYSFGVGTSYIHQFNNLFPGQFNNNFIQQTLTDRVNYSISMSLNIPIFNRFQTKNRVAKSVINKEQSILALENQKLQLRQTIEQAFLDVKAAAKTYEAASLSLEAQKEAFKNAQESYNYGAMTQFDYDQVRNRLVGAESASIRAKYDYVFKNKVLKFYFGEDILN